MEEYMTRDYSYVLALIIKVDYVANPTQVTLIDTVLS